MQLIGSEIICWLASLALCAPLLPLAEANGFGGLDAQATLWYACEELELESAEAALRLGADVNAVDDEGATPLLRVFGKRYRYNSSDVDRDSLALAGFLLRNGARLDVGNIEGVNAASLVLTVADEQAWKLLRDHVPAMELLRLAGWEPGATENAGAEGVAVPVPSGCVAVPAEGLEALATLCGLPPAAVDRGVFFVPRENADLPSAEQKTVLACFADPYREVGEIMKHRDSLRLLRYERLSGSSYTWFFLGSHFETGFPDFPRMWSASPASGDGEEEVEDQMLSLCYDRLPGGGKVLLVMYESEPRLNESMERFMATQRAIIAWDTALRESNAAAGQ